MNRRFFAYLCAAAAADSGFWVAQVAQGWLVVKLTDSPLWLGLVSAATQLPFLLFSLAGGSLADRFDRRRIIALNNIAMAAVACLTAVLVATNVVSVWLLALLGFVAGTSNAVEHPVDRAWVYDLAGGKDIGRAISLSSLEWATARTAGPAIGGAAVATLGIAAAYGAYAIFVVPIIIVALLVRTQNSHERGTASTPRERADGSRAIVTFSTFTAAFTIGVSPYVALLPEIAKNTYGQGAGGYGAMAAAGGVGAIAGAAILCWRGEIAHKGRIATISALTGAVLLVTFAMTHAFALAIALLVAMGAVDTLMYALVNTYVQEIAGDAERGRGQRDFFAGVSRRNSGRERRPRRVGESLR